MALGLFGDRREGAATFPGAEAVLGERFRNGADILVATGLDDRELYAALCRRIRAWSYECAFDGSVGNARRRNMWNRSSSSSAWWSKRSWVKNIAMQSVSAWLASPPIARLRRAAQTPRCRLWSANMYSRGVSSNATGSDWVSENPGS